MEVAHDEPRERPGGLTGLFRMLRIDVARRAVPSPARLLVATVISLAASLGADALLVAAGEALAPATKGYVHFRFGDYGKLTVIGVLVACAAWPLTVRLSWAPRWLFLRLAVAVTALLWLPDLYILANGQPANAVVVLMAMHLAIAVVTYNALVRVAPSAARRTATVTR